MKKTALLAAFIFFYTSFCFPDGPVSPTIGMLVSAPAGKFQRDAISANQSTVSPFYISKYEITRAQWRQIFGDTSDPSELKYSGSLQDPVQMVNWFHTIAFCNKLSLKEGLTPVYEVPGVDFATLTFNQIPLTSNTDWNKVSVKWSADGYRLPTEMGWLWVAMGAVSKDTGYLKPFSGSTGNNAIGDYVVYAYNLGQPGAKTTMRTSGVGSKLTNELGIHDMSGNVWEWNWDGDVVLPSGLLVDYKRGEREKIKVRHGGSWSQGSVYSAILRRGSTSPYSRTNACGFRVVRARN